ncbi:MAG: hypothetical protein CVU48_09450 [Candidatus Cloacimonetes bacterium HGW-Cloacimonetes-1]|jgi:voltage-gated potassium channel|nr:MAG: hypothetical protein CVU48_09450 [Candidatus Cloacimonetes bacterium HGW-Cloacimonetes-1]
MFTKERDYTHPGLYRHFIDGLTFYILIVFVLQTVVNISTTIQTVLNAADFVVCVIFILDWLYFLMTTKDRKRYVIRRFVDLISSIPYLQSVRWLRMFRVFRIFRSLRGIEAIFRKLCKTPMTSALLLYSSFLVVIFSYCSLLMYRFELGINQNIKSFYDIIWLCFSTLTTVGFGDIYPVTTEGKIISAVLVIVGTGFFALLSGEFAALILKYSRNLEQCSKGTD